MRISIKKNFQCKTCGREYGCPTCGRPYKDAKEAAILIQKNLASAKKEYCKECKPNFLHKIGKITQKLKLSLHHRN